MWRKLKRLLKAAVLPTIFSGVCVYFAWHAVHGARGLDAREERLAQIAQARQELAKAEAERDAMERRVRGLSPESIDRDQLDERARALLNMMGKDEVVIPYGDGRRLY
ncbi:septum formation initiator family protein [Acetobacteraceae bacterium H6797]|nr:septum formation initiator family protein [Acetobacteraceae bacterium H6797]